MTDDKRPGTPDTPDTPDVPSAPQPPQAPEPPQVPEPPQFPETPEQPTSVLPEQDQQTQAYPTQAYPTEAFPGQDQPTQMLPPQQDGPYQDGSQQHGAPGAPVPPGPPAPGPYYDQGGYPQQAPMNALALVAFIGSFFVSLVGIICGHISLSQIKKSGERGRGFALAGTIIGYVMFGLQILALILILWFASIGAGIASSIGSAVEEEGGWSESSPSPTEEPFGDDDPFGEDDPSTEFGSGDVSPELCDALDRVMEEAANIDMTDPEPPAAFIDAFRDAAAADGPNQDVYERYVELVDEGTMESSSELIDMSGELSNAMSDDYVSCM